MPTLMEKVSVVNSAVRTVLLLALLGGFGVVGWYAYDTYYASSWAAKRASERLAAAEAELDRANDQLDQKNRMLKEKDVEISKLDRKVQRQELEIQQLSTSLQLLKVTHRIARLDVLDQTIDPQSDEKWSVVEFQELDDRGVSIDKAKRFRIRGDLVYIDSWVVKFDDKYIEEADIDRSTSLVIFRRLFGEYQEPKDGFALDEEGARPVAYERGGRMTEFEKKIWNDFWNLANDEAQLNELGIRAAHGDAPSIRVQKGKSYRIDLRASDGLSITPEGTFPRRTNAPAT